MKRLFFIFLSSTALLISSQTLADDVLPPPENATHTQATTAADSATADESSVDLNKELAPPSNHQAQVQVNTYVRESDQATITEYSMHGKVYMIKVEPVGGIAPYYLYDEKGTGTFSQRLPGGYKPLNPPEWVIHRF